MEYNIVPKCRKYKGKIIFRSTLEASWAMMFDALNWSWEYEPEKFKHHYSGWTPDFCINGNILVEVKPFSNEEDFTDTARYIESVKDSSFEGLDILLLGVSIFNDEGSPVLGWILDSYGGLNLAQFSYNDSIGYGFASEYGDWKCKIHHINPQTSPKGASWWSLFKKWKDAENAARKMPEVNCPDFDVGPKYSDIK